MTYCKCGKSEFRLLLLNAWYDSKEWKWEIPMSCATCEKQYALRVSPRMYNDFLTQFNNGRECLVKLGEEVN